MFRKTYELGQLKVTVEMPEVLAEDDACPTFSFHPSAERFEEVVEMLGGPLALHGGSTGAILWGSVDGETLVMLNVPRHAVDPPPVPKVMDDFLKRRALADATARQWIAREVRKDGSYSEDILDAIVDKLREQGVKDGDEVTREMIDAAGVLEGEG